MFVTLGVGVDVGVSVTDGVVVGVTSNCVVPHSGTKS